ncbi:MAG: electron transfer flavoprotein subunit alpha [Acidobacteriia bacterium]|nr:electron transfer flavoprotein subunit alpha [Terriglobia bacterium]
MAETILFLGHTEAAGELSRITLEALGAAKSLAGERVVGLVGRETLHAAESIGSCGASRFLAVTGEPFSVSRYATDCAAAEAICRAAGATIVIAPHTSRWARSLPGVAQRLGGRADTHITGITSNGSSLQVARWFYRQRMEALLGRAQRPWILLLESGCRAAWQGDTAPVTLENIEVEITPALVRTTVTGKQAPRSELQTIRPDAALLFVAGAGWTKKQKDGAMHVGQAAELISRFLEVSQASLGSSKSLVDLSGEGHAVLPFLSHLNQVGQTGSTPRHPKGLATCCHGEEPHVVGWRFIQERRAVNLDPNCGWARGKADVLYVADAFEVMARVNALLEER